MTAPSRAPERQASAASVRGKPVRSPLRWLPWLLVLLLLVAAAAIAFAVSRAVIQTA